MKLKSTIAGGTLLLCGCVAANAASQTNQAGGVQIAQTEERIIIGSALPSAKDLKVDINCDRVRAGAPLAQFSWSAPDAMKGRQRIEVTPYRNGFANKEVQALGELEDKQRSFEWGGGDAGLNYYWRVLTRTPDGWVASEVARYEVPTCPVDFEKPEGSAN